MPARVLGSVWPRITTAIGVARYAILALLYFALWLYMRPYFGLHHDAQAYAAEAVAAVDPVPLASDIFLAFRSQDEYTIFPLLYGHLINAIGLDSASSVLTLVSQGLWYFAAFLLLRRLAGGSLAWLGLGMLLTAPLVYGGLRVFNLAEPFLTARLPAEALALLSLWLWLSKRRLFAVGTVILAFAMHPLMAFPVALLLLMLWAATHTSDKVMPLLVGTGCLLAVGGSYLLGGQTPLIDGRWLAITQIRSNFLFLDRWDLNDWNHTLLTVLTLSIGIRALGSTNVVATLRAALWLALGGMALAALTSFVVHLEILIEGQPWRWIWPARFLAVGCLPAIVISLWGRDGTGRASAVFLAAAWLFVLPFSAHSSTLFAMGSLLAMLSFAMLLANERISPEMQTPILRGAFAVLATVIVGAIVTASLALLVPESEQPMSHGALTRISNILSLNTPAILIAVGSASSLLFCWHAVRGALVLALAVTLLGLAAPTAFASWIAQTYTGSDRNAFSEWRREIPVDAQVFWWERLRETWFLLDRRAYLTRSQSGGVVFSSQLADEVARRALVLEPLSIPEFWLGMNAREDREANPLTAEILATICRDPDLGFVVDDEELDLAISVVHWPRPDDTLYLYDCGTVRKSDGDIDG